MVWWNQILDYVFPKECFGCQKEGEYLCSACFDKISYSKDQKCYLCHKDNQIDGICLGCRSEFGIEKIEIATGYNDNVVGVLVENLKYNYIEGISRVLAKVIDIKLRQSNQTNFLYNKVVLPIPLHKKRYKERGFNQTEKILCCLQSQYDLRIENDLIVRERYTDQQAKLERIERQVNVQDCFKFNIKKDIPDEVILFDDVLTTGSTFIEAAKCLKQAGVKKVKCLAVCHG